MPGVGKMAVCSVCKEEFSQEAEASLFGEAGQWLASEIWHDAGELCPRCLENRARLALMYIIDR